MRTHLAAILLAATLAPHAAIADTSIPVKPQQGGCSAPDPGQGPDFSTWLKVDPEPGGARVRYHVSAACDAKLDFRARRAGDTVTIKVTDTNTSPTRASCACPRLEVFALTLPAGKYHLVVDHGPYGTHRADVTL